MHRVDYCGVQRIVHHVVEVEHREARVEVGGNARSADWAMPSARAAASCAASPRAGVHRHARVTESIFTAPVGLSSPRCAVQAAEREPKPTKSQRLSTVSKANGKDNGWRLPEPCMLFVFSEEAGQRVTSSTGSVTSRRPLPVRRVHVWRFPRYSVLACVNA